MTSAPSQNQAIDIASALSTFQEHWSQRRIASVDDAYDIKIAKLKGAFVWHSHPDADETFYVLSGILIIHLKEEDGGPVELRKNQIFVVKRGVQHKPETKDGTEVEVMIIEKKGVVNTGDAVGAEGLKKGVTEL